MWTCPLCGACPHGVCGYAPQWEVDIPHSGIKQSLDLTKTNDTPFCPILATGGPLTAATAASGARHTIHLHPR